MLTIRLRRQGSTNSPFYRVVLSDSRRVPQATALEELGYYNPSQKPAQLQLEHERIDHWMSQGARLSETVANLRKRSLKAAAAPVVEEPAAMTAKRAKDKAASETPVAREATAAPAEASEAVEA